MQRYFSTLIAVGVFLTTTAFSFLDGDTESVEGRLYRVTMSETKNGKTKDPIDGELTFKSGKLRSKILREELGADAIAIELTTDSVYKSDDEQVDYIVFEGEMTNKDDETVKVKGTIDGYGIEGFVELSKGGKVKRHFDFVGFEQEND
jgi:hypothetical protein